MLFRSGIIRERSFKVTAPWFFGNYVVNTLVINMQFLQNCMLFYNALSKKYSICYNPEFCKRLSKKCSEHRINKGVQSIFEMHRSVVFFSIFEFIKILYFYVLIHGYFFDF